MGKYFGPLALLAIGFVFILIGFRLINTKKSTQGFIGGVAILTVSSAVVKLIGLFYKIPLIQLIGIEGMAYFLAAYHIYTLLFTLSNAGLPVAVSIL